MLNEPQIARLRDTIRRQWGNATEIVAHKDETIFGDATEFDGLPIVFNRERHWHLGSVSVASRGGSLHCTFYRFERDADAHLWDEMRQARSHLEWDISHSTYDKKKPPERGLPGYRWIVSHEGWHVLRSRADAGNYIDTMSDPCTIFGLPVEISHMDAWGWWRELAYLYKSDDYTMQRVWISHLVDQIRDADMNIVSEPLPELASDPYVHSR